MIVDVTDLQLSDLRVFVTRRDGGRVHFHQLLTSLSMSDHVNTAAMEVSMEIEGTAEQTMAVGLEGSTVVVTAPVVNIRTGKTVREEVFRGTITTSVEDDQSGAQDHVIRSLTVHDPLWYWRSEGDWVWKNSTLSNIFHGICDSRGVPKGDVTRTTQKLGAVIGRGATMWDIMQQAIQRHRDRTGEFFQVYSSHGRVHLREQGDQDRWWVFERGRNLQAFRRTRTLDEMKNDVLVYGVYEEEDDKPKIAARFEDEESQELYGTISHTEYIPSAEEAQRVKDTGKKILERNSKPDEQIEVSGWIVPMLRAGEQVRLRNRPLGVWGGGRYYVESLEAKWTQDKADSHAVCRKDPVDPGLIVEAM